MRPGRPVDDVLAAVARIYADRRAVEPHHPDLMNAGHGDQEVTTCRGGSSCWGGSCTATPGRQYNCRPNMVDPQIPRAAQGPGQRSVPDAQRRRATALRARPRDRRHPFTGQIDLADQVVLGIRHVERLGVQRHALGRVELGRSVVAVGPANRPRADGGQQGAVASSDHNAVMSAIGHEQPPARLVRHDLARKPQGAGKGVRNLLCEAPFGPFRQKVPDTFSSPVERSAGAIKRYRLRQDGANLLEGYLAAMAPNGVALGVD